MKAKFGIVYHTFLNKAIEYHVKKPYPTEICPENTALLLSLTNLDFGIYSAPLTAPSTRDAGYPELRVLNNYYFNESRQDAQSRRSKGSRQDAKSGRGKVQVSCVK
jgi:hypothetical protein